MLSVRQQRRTGVDIASFVTRQLPYIGPMLVVYLVGIVLSLVNLKRFAKPAALTLAGCGLLFLVTLAFPFVQGYLFELRNERGGGFEQYERQMLIVGIASTLLRVVAFSLLLTAVFSGRRAFSESGYWPGFVGVEPPDSSRQPHRATLVLVLGILSLIVCAPLGIAAWVMGSNDLAAMRAGRMDRSGESLTGVGQVLGVIGTVLFGLGIVGALLWFVAVGAMLQGVR
jgi:hypothetical protein